MLTESVKALGIVLFCLQISFSYQLVSLKTYDEISAENEIELPEHITRIVENVFANLTKSNPSNELITNLRYVDHNDAKTSMNTNGGSQESFLMDKHAQLTMKAYEELLNYEGDEDLENYIENLKIPTKYCSKLNIKCDPYYPYRKHDGSCNNLEHTWWGKANIPYRRMLRPRYEDKVGTKRSKAKDGYPLMNERLISLILVPSFETESKWSIFFLSFGQFLTHDMTQFGITTNADGTPKACTCDSIDKDCMSVPTPHGDFINHDQRCMVMTRGSAAPKDLDCHFGPREQMNLVTAFPDLSVVYGSDSKTADELRTFKKGTLKSSYTPHSNLEELAKRNDSKCPYSVNRAEKCFKAGDSRAEDNLLLLSQHALWLREHNRVARKLAYLNPKWDDETIYQEARRIVIAEYQHIISNEYLPTFLGEKVCREFDLLPQKNGYYMNYDKKLQAGIINEFAGAAFRVSHTIVNDEHELADKYLRAYETHNISVLQFNTVKFAIKAPLEDVLYGSLNKSSYIKACQLNKDMNNFLFDGVFSNKHTKRWGLFTRNLARGRDFGFPGYNEFREKCGLNRAERFEDLSNNIPEYIIQRLKKVYRHVDDIELFAGMISEESLKGAFAGFTSACLTGKQFSDMKKGDRFWYENGHDKNLKFTRSQLQEIREVSIARIICDNTNAKYIQRYPFLMPHPDYNPWVDCKNLPKVDLKHWEDYAYAIKSDDQEDKWTERDEEEGNDDDFDQRD